MKKWLALWSFVLAMTWVSPSFAVLDLELTNGTKRSVPLGVGRVTGTAAETTRQHFVQVIENDLRNSGWFRLLFSPKNTTVAFSAKGANAFFTGTVNRQPNGELLVNMKLMGLYSGSGNGEQLLNTDYRVRPKNLRSLAHRISDQIFEKLTGVRGNFSTKLAYITVHYPPKKYVNFNLMVSDSDGHNPQLLLRSYEPIMSLAWSPDGKKLAYVSFANHRAQIFLQTLATGKRERVIASPGIDGAPAFSPDGKHMALVLTKTGNPKIYDLNLTTKKLMPITKGWSIDTEPAWSPDGQSLLFTSNRDGTPQIYQYSFRTHQVKRLTFNGNYNARARWLPSGQGFVMMHKGERSTGFSVALQHLGTGILQNLTAPGKVESPSVAPNGQMVVYAMGKGLGQVSIDSDVTLSLLGREGVIQEPVWSPFMG